MPGGKVPIPTTQAPVVEEPPMPIVTLAVRPSPWKTGLKAGGKALIYALVFAGLEYWVHKELEKELEESLEMARKGSLPWARHEKQRDNSRPVYVRWTIESKEYSKYIPFLGWMPQTPVLHMTSMAMVREEIVSPPMIETVDNRLDLFHPGVTTTVTYTELMVP